jgi:hypothetical protein
LELSFRLYQSLHQCKKTSETQKSIISPKVVRWTRFWKSITQPTLHKVMNSLCHASYTKEMWLKFHRSGFHHKLSSISKCLRTEPQEEQPSLHNATYTSTYTSPNIQKNHFNICSFEIRNENFPIKFEVQFRATRIF